jgi:hypothetical protein
MCDKLDSAKAFGPIPCNFEFGPKITDSRSLQLLKQAASSDSREGGNVMLTNLDSMKAEDSTFSKREPEANVIDIGFLH